MFKGRNDQAPMAGRPLNAACAPGRSRWAHRLRRADFTTLIADLRSLFSNIAFPDVAN
jgi:hypothetical protein